MPTRRAPKTLSDATNVDGAKEYHGRGRLRAVWANGNTGNPATRPMTDAGTADKGPDTTSEVSVRALPEAGRASPTANTTSTTAKQNRHVPEHTADLTIGDHSILQPGR
jgi:hypothetical protein